MPGDLGPQPTLARRGVTNTGEDDFVLDKAFALIEASGKGPGPVSGCSADDPEVGPSRRRYRERLYSTAEGNPSTRPAKMLANS